MPPKRAKKSVQKKTGCPPTTRQKRKASDAFFSAANEKKRAQGKRTGDTKADRAQSGRAAAFAKEQARGKPPKAVVEDDVAAAEPAAAKAATAAMFSDDDDDDDVSVVVDQPAPEPFTPSKCGGELFVTPSKCYIIATLRVTCQSFARGTGKKGTVTVGKLDGVENETAIARAGEDVINKACGICWKSGALTSGGKHQPAWPNPTSPLRGFRFKRLEHEGPLVPRSLYIGLREIVEYYNCDMKNVAAAVQV